MCVELVKPRINYDKPIGVGFSCLELSKLFMFQFHYDVLRKRFPDAQLAFTDTDSFLYEIPTEDIYSDLTELKDHFDFSNYPPDHNLYSTANKATIGKMKDECGSKVISSFIGLHAKLYSLITADGKQTVKAAGVKKHIAKRDLKHAIFKAAVEEIPFNLETDNGNVIELLDYPISQHSFRSYNHNIKTIRQTRTGVSAYDDKRWLSNCGILTRAHGHYLNESE